VVRRPAAGQAEFLGERPDGKLITYGFSEELVKRPDGRVVRDEVRRWFVTAADGKTSTKIAFDAFTGMTANDQLSADGRRMLSVSVTTRKRPPASRSFDLDKGTRTDLTIPGLPEKHYVIERARWSPDGKKIAFYYMTTEEDAAEPWWRWPRSPDAALCVADADGKNVKVIRKDKVERFHYFQWK